MTKDPAIAAHQLKQLLIDSSPLIEEYTSKVCPGCIEVCCRQKHGTYRETDRAYLRSLGEDVPPRDGSRPLEGPCELMGPKGCVHPRWMRPFKCTWFFCGPLLTALDEGPTKKARRVSAALQEMADLHAELLKTGFGK